MNNCKKLSIATHIIMVCLVIALMTLGSFYDLQISHALSNGESFFGAFFAIVGEFPAYGGLVVATFILFRYPANRINGNKLMTLTYRVGVGIAMFLALFVWGIKGTSIVEMPSKALFAVMFALIFTVALLYFSRYLSRDTATKYARWAVFAILVIIASVLVVNVCKLSWGRMRYRDMLAIDSFEGFTPWWLPQFGANGVGDAYKSFPSGHSASAVNIFIIASLYDLTPRLRKYRSIAYTACIIFVGMVLLSRIVYNAHFLTDVVMGASISYICYLVAKYGYLNRGKINHSDGVEPPQYDVMI